MCKLKYNCEHCKYSTGDFGNWSRHKKSKRHIKISSNNMPKSENNIKKEITSVNIKKEYICEYCKKKYSKSSNLSRHLKNCFEKNNNLLEIKIEKYKTEKNLEYELKMMEGKLKMMEEKNNMLQNEKKIYMNYVNIQN